MTLADYVLLLVSLNVFKSFKMSQNLVVKFHMNSTKIKLFRWDFKVVYQSKWYNCPFEELNSFIFKENDSKESHIMATVLYKENKPYPKWYFKIFTTPNIHSGVISSYFFKITFINRKQSSSHHRCPERRKERKNSLHRRYNLRCKWSFSHTTTKWLTSLLIWFSILLCSVFLKSSPYNVTSPLSFPRR